MGLETIGLIGLGAAAVGTGLSTAGAMQSQRSMNNTVQDQLNIQAGLSKKAQQAYQDSVSQSTVENAAAQQQKGQQQAQQLYQALQSVPLPQQGSYGTNDPVTQARTSEYIGAQNKAASNLQGYSQYGLSQSLKDMIANEQLKNYGAQSSIYSAALGPEMQQASQSGAPLQFAGQGLSALGSLAGLYGIYSSLPNAAGSGVSAAQSARILSEAGIGGAVPSFNPFTPGLLTPIGSNPFNYNV